MMRSRLPNKPRYSAAKVGGHRTRRSLTGQDRPFERRAQIARERTLAGMLTATTVLADTPAPTQPTTDTQDTRDETARLV
jgi:hypothetical protein